MVNVASVGRTGIHIQRLRSNALSSGGSDSKAPLALQYNNEALGLALAEVNEANEVGYKGLVSSVSTAPQPVEQPHSGDTATPLELVDLTRNRPPGTVLPL